MMNQLDLTTPSKLLDSYFGNKAGTVKVAFLIVATPVGPEKVGETSIISNITDNKTVLRVMQEVINALRLNEAQPGGTA
jgi:hypothetical protein